MLLSPPVVGALGIIGVKWHSQPCFSDGSTLTISLKKAESIHLFSKKEINMKRRIVLTLVFSLREQTVDIDLTHAPLLLDDS